MPDCTVPFSAKTQLPSTVCWFANKKHAGLTLSALPRLFYASYLPILDVWLGQGGYAHYID